MPCSEHKWSSGPRKLAQSTSRAKRYSAATQMDGGTSSIGIVMRVSSAELIGASGRSALLLRRTGVEIRVFLCHPVDELAHVGIGQKRADVERMTLQLGIGEVGDQGLLTDGMHGHDIAPAPALWHWMMPDCGLAKMPAAQPARHRRFRFVLAVYVGIETMPGMLACHIFAPEMHKAEQAL